MAFAAFFVVEVTHTLLGFVLDTEGTPVRVTARCWSDAAMVSSIPQRHTRVGWRVQPMGSQYGKPASPK